MNFLRVNGSGTGDSGMLDCKILCSNLEIRLNQFVRLRLILYIFPEKLRAGCLRNHKNSVNRAETGGNGSRICLFVSSRSTALVRKSFFYNAHTRPSFDTCAFDTFPMINASTKTGKQAHSIFTLKQCQFAHYHLIVL